MLNQEQNQEQNQEEYAPLTYKETKALKKSNYYQICEKFNKIFVLENTKTGQIVELRAASSLHACNIIGWKPNKVRVVEEKIKDMEKTSTIEKK